jgi:hypothetical protein
MLRTMGRVADPREFNDLVITSINGTRRVGVARMYPNGAVDTHWLDTAYCQFAGLHKVYYNTNVDPKNFLLATGVQPERLLGHLSYRPSANLRIPRFTT